MYAPSHALQATKLTSLVNHAHASKQDLLGQQQVEECRCTFDCFLIPLPRSSKLCLNCFRLSSGMTGRLSARACTLLALHPTATYAAYHMQYLSSSPKEGAPFATTACRYGGAAAAAHKQHPPPTEPPPHSCPGQSTGSRPPLWLEHPQHLHRPTTGLTPLTPSPACPPPSTHHPPDASPRS